MTAVVLSIQVGLPRHLGTSDATSHFDQPWTSGFFKEPIAGPVHVGWTNLSGDGQADLVNHGGVDKAVLAYAATHYPAWRAELGQTELPYGAFGENLTIDGVTEGDVCIGDVWRAGLVVFEVSQPRQPCWKLARRWRIQELPGRVVETGRSGWYLRVREMGTIEAGTGMELVARPNPEWTVTRANHVMYFQRLDTAAMEELAAVPGLSASWQETLVERARRLHEAKKVL
ncbi:MOSC domain-containing protein [Fimbriiglobus ruber]|uniref:MOSC domain-containing protein n=1 Tax=Fimbriiglobus ruber TaxID=1908690 RepID=A0A225E7X7_9BACT|nr:MOSC domain-containing protein [Fimbriiglobus ruber]OWK44527.1 hypothetical protein FRUB_02459 [Fimbriiglobus ruber]